MRKSIGILVVIIGWVIILLSTLVLGFVAVPVAYLLLTGQCVPGSICMGDVAAPPVARVIESLVIYSCCLLGGFGLKIVAQKLLLGQRKR